MRTLGIGMLALALAACSPPVPDSGADADLDYTSYLDSGSYRAARDAELAGSQPQTVLPPPRTGDTDVRGNDTRTVETRRVETRDGRTVTTGSGAVTSNRGNDGGVVQASPSNPRPVAVDAPNTEGRTQRVITTNNPRISDEQDFTAVSDRESIESDRERLLAQREAREVIEPTAIPTRGADGPNVVAFALSTNNAVGQKIYRRTPLNSSNRTERNCARYANADLAQEAFLSAGGPERDRLRLDPDGDGFACNWDPAPYRRLAASRG